MNALRSLPILILALAFAGCAHSQVPPVSHSVSLTWTAPGSCTTASPCTYVISRITVSGTCPTPNLTTPNYTPLNSANATSLLTYSDSAAGGLNVCYIAQTEQGSSVSQPSNTAGPFAVPANAQAPTLGTGTVSKAEPPLSAPTTVASATPSGLKGTIGR